MKFDVSAAVAANTIGATCEATAPNTKANCEDENALCPAASGGRCVCKDGYVGVTGGGCSEFMNSLVPENWTLHRMFQSFFFNKLVCSSKQIIQDNAY